MALLSNIPVRNLPFSSLVSIPSLSLAPTEAFNKQAKIGFGMMLENTRETSQERISF